MLSPRLFFRWIFMSTPAIVIHANLFSLKVLCVLFKCFNPNVSRVLSRVKQTIASIKLVIGIGKEGRQTVCPFYYVLIKTMALMTLAKLTNTPCVQADQCPYFSYFSYFFLLFDPEPYFLGKQPYYPYFLGCHVVELNKEHLKHVFLH